MIRIISVALSLAVATGCTPAGESSTGPEIGPAASTTTPPGATTEVVNGAQAEARPTNTPRPERPTNPPRATAPAAPSQAQRQWTEFQRYGPELGNFLTRSDEV